MEALKYENIKTLKHENKKTKQDYYLIVSRIAGAKGIVLAMKAAGQLGFRLKIVGERSGLRWNDKEMERLQTENIEFTGWVEDEQLWQLYAEAKGFLALAKDEDFGITVVEAQACGTAVIAYYGGGYKETVVEAKTGVFFRDYSVQGLIGAILEFEKNKFKRANLVKNARRFSREKFVVAMRKVAER